MKRAMLKVDEELGDLGEQILQIHDSILVECPKENGEKVAEVLKNVMENIAPELKIALKVDVHIGETWGDL
jgi:DNA polymerase-1